MDRSLKFCIEEVKGLYYLCSENKGAAQLRGYREADLRLCFRICINPVFLRRGSITMVVQYTMVVHGHLTILYIWVIGFETTAAKQNPFLSKYECLVLSVCDLFNQSALFGFNYRNENAIRYELDNSDTDTITCHQSHYKPNWWTEK